MYDMWYMIWGMIYDAWCEVWYMMYGMKYNVWFDMMYMYDMMWYMLWYVRYDMMYVMWYDMHDMISCMICIIWYDVYQAETMWSDTCHYESASSFTVETSREAHLHVWLIQKQKHVETAGVLQPLSGWPQGHCFQVLIDQIWVSPFGNYISQAALCTSNYITPGSARCLARSCLMLKINQWVQVVPAWCIHYKVPSSFFTHWL